MFLKISNPGARQFQVMERWQPILFRDIGQVGALKAAARALLSPQAPVAAKQFPNGADF